MDRMSAVRPYCVLCRIAAASALVREVQNMIHELQQYDRGASQAMRVVQDKLGQASRSWLREADEKEKGTR